LKIVIKAQNRRQNLILTADPSGDCVGQGEHQVGPGRHQVGPKSVKCKETLCSKKKTQTHPVTYCKHLTTLMYLNDEHLFSISVHVG